VNIWGQFVNTLAFGIFFLSQAFGGNTGLAIITLSCVIRLAILPISISIQRRTRQQQEILQRIQPKMDKLRSRYKNNPEKLSQKTMQLYKTSGYKPFDLVNILGSFIQLPVVAGLYSAIRQGISSTGPSFLWIKNLAQPDALLAIIVAGLTYLASRFSADSTQQVRYVSTILPAAITLFFAWRLAAGLGLYWATSTTIGMAQSVMIKRSSKKLTV
jgi:YidC/Oxa1 family membrane protein insertase